MRLPGRWANSWAIACPIIPGPTTVIFFIAFVSILFDLPSALSRLSTSLLPSDLAAATRRPESVLVAHYFNPPYLMPLVEIVRGKSTSEETVNKPYPILLEKVKKGELGAKTGKGFYEWTPEFTEAWRKKMIKNLVGFLQPQKD